MPQVIDRLVAAGLDSIPGGGAEILVDRVRKLLNCYGKATADEWLDVMREAHRAGLRTTATMMYGHVETPQERLEHMFRLRDLQDESRRLPAAASAKAGFTAFITWSYQPEHTELGGFEATGVEYLRTLAIARIVLDNFDNLQASWVTQGGKVGQLSLAYGANDMGSVMIEENVVRAAGAAYCMDEIEIVRNIENAGFTAQAAQHALRDPWGSGVPSAPRPPYAGTRRRADRRRHEPPAGDRQLLGTQRFGEAPATQWRNRALSTSHRALDEAMTFRARWVLPIAQPPIADGWVAVASGHDHLRSADLDRTARVPSDGPVLPPPSFPDWSTRTRTSSSRGCATRCRRRPACRNG